MFHLFIIQNVIMLLLMQLSRWAHDNFPCFHFVNAERSSARDNQEFKLNMNGLDDDGDLDDDRDELYEFEFTFLNIRNVLRQKQQFIEIVWNNKDNISNLDDLINNLTFVYKDRGHLLMQNLVRVGISDKRLEIETYDTELICELIESLGDDLTNSDKLLRCDLHSVELKLDCLIENEHQLKESERRTQSELYESADYTKQLVQQLACAIELDEL